MSPSALRFTIQGYPWCLAAVAIHDIAKALVSWAHVSTADVRIQVVKRGPIALDPIAQKCLKHVSDLQVCDLRQREKPSCLSILTTLLLVLSAAS